VRSKKVPSARAASSYRAPSEDPLFEIFVKVRSFVYKNTGKFEHIALNVPCQEIDVLRRTKRGYVGGRSFMHVGHIRNTVCCARPAEFLSDGHLVGLLLHEFGHLGGGHSEPSANAWIKSGLGVEILYKGPLDLQWVGPDVVAWVLR
jgi:hypothetical protein